MYLTAVYQHDCSSDPQRRLVTQHHMFSHVLMCLFIHVEISLVQLTSLTQNQTNETHRYPE